VTAHDSFKFLRLRTAERNSTILVLFNFECCRRRIALARENLYEFRLRASPKKTTRRNSTNLVSFDFD
jgi:hypothetical protein